MSIKFRALESFAALCGSVFKSINTHKIPNADGLDCQSCLKVVANNDVCCCNCFALTFAGTEFWLQTTVISCQPYISPEDPEEEPYCEWTWTPLSSSSDPARSFMIRAYNSAAPATLVITSGEDSNTYTCQNFTCLGGLFVCEEPPEDFPSTLAVTPIRCDESSSSSSSSSADSSSSSSSSSSSDICGDICVWEFDPETSEFTLIENGCGIDCNCASPLGMNVFEEEENLYSSSCTADCDIGHPDNPGRCNYVSVEGVLLGCPGFNPGDAVWRLVDIDPPCGPGCGCLADTEGSCRFHVWYGIPAVPDEEMSISCL